MVDYGRHTLRLTKEVEARVRRMSERFKEAMDTAWVSIDSVTADTTNDAQALTITTTTTENLADPTALGQRVMRVIASNAGADVYTLDFDTNAQIDTNTYDKMQSSIVGAYVFLESTYYSGSYRWIIRQYSSSFTLVP